MKVLNKSVSIALIWGILLSILTIFPTYATQTITKKNQPATAILASAFSTTQQALTLKTTLSKAETTQSVPVVTMTKRALRKPTKFPIIHWTTTLKTVTFFSDILSFQRASRTIIPLRKKLA